MTQCGFRLMFDPAYVAGAPRPGHAPLVAALARPARPPLQPSPVPSSLSLLRGFRRPSSYLGRPLRVRRSVPDVASAPCVGLVAESQGQLRLRRAGSESRGALSGWGFQVGGWVRLGAPFAWPRRQPGTCRERNRRLFPWVVNLVFAGCTPGRFLVASGDRRREHPTGPSHPPENPSRTAPPCSLSRPAGGALDLDFHPPTRRTEPALRQAQTDVRVEDDRGTRKDDETPVGAPATRARVRVEGAGGRDQPAQRL